MYICRMPGRHLFRSLAFETVVASAATQQVEYKPRYQRFIVKEKRFTQQFSHIYSKRLTVLRPILHKRAALLWKNGTPLLSAVCATHRRAVTFAEKLTDLTPGKDQVVIGTIYKDMTLKPCILQEFSVEV